MAGYEYIKLRDDEDLTDLSQVFDPSRHYWLKFGSVTERRVEACLNGDTSAQCLTTHTGSSTLYYLQRTQPPYLLFEHFATRKALLLARPVPTLYFEIGLKEERDDDAVVTVTNSITGNEVGNVTCPSKCSICGLKKLIAETFKLSRNAIITFPSLQVSSDRVNAIGALQAAVGKDEGAKRKARGKQDSTDKSTIKRFLKPKD